MRKLLLLSISTIFAGFVNSQEVVFSSNLENWTNDTLNADFNGTRSSLYPISASQGVLKISTGGVYGPSTAQLKNTTTSHKRIQTNPVPVVESTAYDVTFWVKGNGEIRAGIYDNDLSNGDFGFKYAAYNTINSTDWAMFTQQVVADTTTSVAEFILSIRSTTGNHLEIDSVVVTTGTITPPTNVRISTIQATTDGDASNMINQIVSTGGRVSGIVATKGFYIQDGTSLFSGIYVYDQGNNSVAIGDSVLITGKVEEFNFNNSVGKTTQITTLSSFQNKGNFTPYDAIMASTNAVNGEGYESMLVKVDNAIVTQAPNNFKEWKVNDGSGEIMLDDFIYEASPAPQMGQSYMVTGVVGHSFGFYKMYPRFASDVVLKSSSSINENELNKVHVYPTVVESTITIMNAINQKANIVSTDGKTYQSFTVNTSNFEVEVSNLKAGVYFVQLENETIKFVKK